MKIKTGFERFKVISVDKLVKADWNYKADNEEMKLKLKANISRNGLIMNLNVREIGGGKYEVIDGNHRLEAVRELGLPNVMACNHGKMSTKRAKRLAVEINETLFEAGQMGLGEIVVDLTKHFGVDDLIETLPFSKSEVENFQEMVGFDWEKSNKKDKKKKKKVFKFSVQFEGEEAEVVQRVLSEETREKILDMCHREIEHGRE